MENETKAILLLSFLLILLVGNLIFLSSYMSPTGKTISQPAERQYSFTKAICMENVCQDYEIACKNELLIYQKPVSEKVYFPETWQDRRTEEEKSQFCQK